ncbi:MAG: hypothetical protein WCB97_07815 [Thiobacillus sp.]
MIGIQDNQQTHRSAPHLVAFFLYLIFVWGIAYARKDYLWINGDDPNLLQQSLLINAGFVPNVDFFSGYPGLSLYLQALLIKLVGGAPFSQHLYAALQATVLGGVFFWAGQRIAPLLLLLVLLFIYSQGALLNPTPNPGYLFEIAFVVGVKKTWDFLGDARTQSAAFAGAAFSIAFLAKQYGIFGPICFFLATLGLLDIAPPWRRRLFGLSLTIIVAAILYSYFGSFILNTAYGTSGAYMTHEEQQFLLLKNSTIFVIPVAVSLFAYLRVDQKSNAPKLSLMNFLLSNFIHLAVFLSVSVGYLFFQYGLGAVPDILREIMFLAPKRINSYLLEVSFSQAALLRAAYGLLALGVLTFAFLQNRTMVPRIPRTIVYLIGFLVVGVLMVRGANLSATPFLSLGYIGIISVVIYRASSRLVILLASVSPLFVILIPYTNYAYHLPLLIFALLLASNDGPHDEFQSRSKKADLIPYFFVAMLVGVLIFKANRDADTYTRYLFDGTFFVSGDPRWHEAIDEAGKVKRGEGSCSSYGCRYLLLTDDSFSNYGLIIEKTISKK